MKALTSKQYSKILSNVIVHDNKKTVYEICADTVAVPLYSRTVMAIVPKSELDDMCVIADPASDMAQKVNNLYKEMTESESIRVKPVDTVRMIHTKVLNKNAKSVIVLDKADDDDYLYENLYVPKTILNIFGSSKDIFYFYCNRKICVMKGFEMVGVVYAPTRCLFESVYGTLEPEVKA